MVNPFIPENGTAVDSASPDAVLRAMGIELSPATQRLYSSPRSLIWVNKPNLFEELRLYAESHGIHDTFADGAVISRLLASRNPNDRAVADRLMTESVIRTAREISNRSDISDLADAFVNAMAPRNSPDTAQELIERAFDAAGPQHPIYNNMREQYDALLERGNRNDPRLVSLRVNMARIRQNGYDDTIPANSININIPDHHARYNINGAEGTSNVIIGEAPRDGQPVRTTPIARGFIEGMEIQPSWNIPNSIAQRKGLLDPQFLANLRAEYQRSGQQGNLYSFIGPGNERYIVDWNRFNNPDVSPFSQPPSPTNPLGAIKVMLGGEFGRNSIRLHDTTANARSTSFTQYAQSSGCIRVQNIADIAAALARDPNLGQQHGYANNSDFFRAVMQPNANLAGERPEWQFPQFAHTRIPIRPRIAIQTTYNTVTWDAQTQRAVIHRDIYRRDAEADRPSRHAMPPTQFERSTALGVDQADATRPINGVTPRYQT